MHHPMQGIAELPSYARLAAKLLDPQERQDLIAYLEEKPEMADHLASVRAYREEFGV